MVAVTLYIAVNNSPVTGLLVEHPLHATAESSRVSGVSTDLHADPFTKTPPRHSASTVWGPGRTVPVRSAPAGLRIVRLASNMTWKPLMASEP